MEVIVLFIKELKITTWRNLFKVCVCVCVFHLCVVECIIIIATII